jgi:predicted DNA-binding protein
VDGTRPLVHAMNAKKQPRVIRRGPRVQVTLSPEGMVLLERLAKATGEPKATLLGELIEEAMPALEATVKAIEMVREQPREAQRLLANFGATLSASCRSRSSRSMSTSRRRLTAGP